MKDFRAQTAGCCDGISSAGLGLCSWLCCISPASSLEDWLILASTSSLNLNDSWPESGILAQPISLNDIFSWADLIRQLEDILLSKSTWNFGLGLERRLGKAATRGDNLPAYQMKWSRLFIRFCCRSKATRDSPRVNQDKLANHPATPMQNFLLTPNVILYISSAANLVRKEGWQAHPTAKCGRFHAEGWPPQIPSQNSARFSATEMQCGI